MKKHVMLLVLFALCAAIVGLLFYPGMNPRSVGKMDNTEAFGSASNRFEQAPNTSRSFEQFHRREDHRFKIGTESKDEWKTNLNRSLIEINTQSSTARSLWEKYHVSDYVTFIHYDDKVKNNLAFVYLFNGQPLKVQVAMVRFPPRLQMIWIYGTLHALRIQDREAGLTSEDLAASLVFEYELLTLLYPTLTNTLDNLGKRCHDILNIRSCLRLDDLKQIDRVFSMPQDIGVPAARYLYLKYTRYIAMHWCVKKCGQKNTECIIEEYGAVEKSLNP